MQDYNPIEVASELAFEATKKEFLERYPDSKEDDMYAEEQWQDEITYRFTEEVQDIFNYWYGVYLGNLEECSQETEEYE